MTHDQPPPVHLVRVPEKGFSKIDVGDSTLSVVLKSLEKLRFSPWRCVGLALGLF